MRNIITRHFSKATKQIKQYITDYYPFGFYRDGYGYDPLALVSEVEAALEIETEALPLAVPSAPAAPTTQSIRS